MNTTRLVALLVFAGALIESSMGLLNELDLHPKVITVIRLFGLAITTWLALNGVSKNNRNGGGGTPPIGGGGGTPPPKP